MRKRRLLLAVSALTTAIGCGPKKKDHRIYANPKGPHYVDVDAPPADAPSDAPADPTKPEGEP